MTLRGILAAISSSASNDVRIRCSVSELHDTVQVKVAAVRAVKAWTGRGRAPCILNLGTKWGRMESFTAHLLYIRGKKSPLYLLNKRLGRPQSRSVRLEQESNQDPRISTPSLVIVPNTISHLFSVAWCGFCSINRKAKTSYALKSICFIHVE
jgi:hypothetical protein